MNKMVTFLNLKIRRYFLEITLPKRIEREFCINYSLPGEVKFYRAAEAIAAGFPPTGWFNYRTREIGIVVEPERGAKNDWLWAKFVTLHENLHRIWNICPADIGVKTQQEASLLNIIRDASNEQRAFLSSLWARPIVRIGRQLTRSEFWQEIGNNPMPGSSEANVVFNCLLIIHTLLCSDFGKVLIRLYKKQITALELLAFVVPKMPELPPNVPELLSKVFPLAVAAWQEYDQGKQLALVREILTHFPPDIEINVLLCMGAGGEHLGGDVPTGQAQDEPPEVITILDDDNDEDGEYDPEGYEVEAEMKKFTAQARDSYPPENPQPLIDEVRDQVGIFARQLEFGLAKKGAAWARQGNLNINRIISNPDCHNPFRRKSGWTKAVARDVMIHIIADDSASIQIEQREVPLKKALMLAHLGFELKGITHRITSSSAGRIMVDNGIDSDVAKTLIAGFFAYENYDNFDERLPLYLNSLNHTAYLHVVIPVTDGKWNCGNGIIKAVAAFTQAGGIFHTVALDIHIRDTSLPGFLQEQQVSALKSADFAEKFGELLATLYFKATAGN